MDELLDRHRDRFRRLIDEIVAEEREPDPFRVTLDAYLASGDAERAELIARAGRRRRQRIEQAMSDTRATWVVLLGDDVVLTSRDRESIPTPEEIIALGRARNLVPFLFEAALVEELPFRSSWAPTDIGVRGDTYPTLPLKVGTQDLVADLDTGAHGTFLDHQLAEDRDASHVWFEGMHLGASFRWRPGRVAVEVGLEGGELRCVLLPVRWVRDWSHSPFVRVNPTRTALAGRDLLRAIGVTVVLRASIAESLLAP